MLSRFSYVEQAAEKKRVLYEGTSVIYQGMPVCYNFDTTDNIDGYDIVDGAGSTTDEGHQNEGKYVRVEDPAADNIQWFAGVVAGTEHEGVTGTGEKWLEIYIPNGAIVPVRTDQNCLIGQTILAVTTASQELGVPLVTDSRAVAVAMETIDRGTAGLVLARLSPNQFMYQDNAGTALSVDDADTTTATMVNHINLKFLGSASTQLGLYCKGTIAAAGACLSGMWYFETFITTTPVNLCHTLGAALVLSGDDATLASSSGEVSAAFRASIYTTGTTAADLSDGDIACILCTSYIDDGVTTPGSIYGLFFHTNNATYHVFTHLFGARHALDIAFTVGSAATNTASIPIEIAGVTHYLMVSAAAVT